jgi:phosphoribosylformylglycinamidine synthase II
MIAASFESAWEVEVRWRPEAGRDPRAEELRASILDWLEAPGLEVEVSDLYYLKGSGLDAAAVELAASRLLSDPVTQRVVLAFYPPEGDRRALGPVASRHVATVFKKPGVMEPVEASLIQGLRDLGIGGGGAGIAVRTGRRVAIAAPLDAGKRRLLAEKVLSNPAIEDVYWDDDPIPSPFTRAAGYRFALRRVPLAGLSDEELLRISREGQLSLALIEMQAVRDHFARLGRDPSDVELETIAQTWSEHCCHKTFTSPIEHVTESGTWRIESLLRETIRRATETVNAEREARGEAPFCLSVFVDNAGVVAFDDEYALSFKVETHNHPSAIEPYGGAGTGIGGVLRDTLGTGLGAKPIINTDVFCLGPPDLPRDRLPPGTLHPRRVLHGVVGGVRDYGNRMGIPTASGALFFDERYVANPLVFCGSVGLLPRDAIYKRVEPGDRIYLLGGRTGRDGVHGATFSSVELSEESETVSSGAVQIGNAITEKKLLDVLLAARDRRLFRAVTDCGAGGLSSAAGEMGSGCGVRVDLERVPLKYEGLSYTEIWISEAQERMVLAVPPERIAELEALARGEDVECTGIGEFTASGRLELFYEGEQVADLEMAFLHEGRPAWTRRSLHRPAPLAAADLGGAPPAGKLLLSILSSPNVASKEWVIRQYDHEVQGRSVLKPLQGRRSDGPGDGVAFQPRFDSPLAVVIGCGLNPRYGDLDPYRMAVSAVDEAVRNVVAAGGDPARTALLDNFCWGSSERPESLGSLVEAARGCRDAAVALGAPFISGKDSLNNEYRSGGRLLSIPPSLLISALAIAPDARRLVSMDLKAPGNRLVLVGETRAELGGSHLLGALGRGGGIPPGLGAEARRLHAAVHRAIEAGLVLSCHDLSEGGLAVAAAEMAFSGEVGAELRLEEAARIASAEVEDDLTLLFSESNTRYLLEVPPGDAGALLEIFTGLPAAVVGETIEYRILRILGRGGQTALAEALGDLKEAWQHPLRSP